MKNKTKLLVTTIIILFLAGFTNEIFATDNPITPVPDVLPIFTHEKENDGESDKKDSSAIENDSGHSTDYKFGTDIVTTTIDMVGHHTDNVDMKDITDISGKIIKIIQIIGTILAVVVLMILGIKYMLGSLEEKAQYKKAMIPYLVGAFLIFAGTTIVSIVYNMILGIIE